MAQYATSQTKKNSSSASSAASYAGLSGSQQNAAISYNRRVNQGICRQIQQLVGTAVDGLFGPNTVNAIAAWQARNGLAVDGQFGPASKRKANLGGGSKSGSTGGARLTKSQQDAAIRYNRSVNQGICRQIQRLVGTTADGSFGPNTVNAIAAWQARNGLAVDGQFGPASKRKANLGGGSSNSGSSARLTKAQERTAINYNRSNNQWLCREIQKVVGTTVDGAFGPNTVNAIAAWQASNGLTVDGQFGPASKRKAGIGSGGSVKGLNANPTLSKNSIKVASEMKSTGWCATGVSRAVGRTYGIFPSGNGNSIGPNLPKQYFRAVPGASLSQALQVPGIVLTWQQTGTKLGKIYGHTAISVGDGYASTSDYYEYNTIASSHHRTGFKAYTTY